METFWRILEFILPTLIVVGVVVWMLSRQSAEDDKRRRYHLFRENQKTATPIRFTAYERLVLFLERISPESMLVRLQDNSQTSVQFHAALLTMVRAEYEHNVSQQVYVSDEAWTMVKNAKESIVQLINACAATVPPTNSSMDLAKTILATYEASQESPTAVAVSFLKHEVQQYFSA
ncbi:MAG: hypothetical protein J6Y77_04475 [Paludibacteraceae bacterium]|nr:hypothetical protein [Paludibacteraceae bacterium]